VQGGIFPDLRRQSAEFIASQNLPGHAIGGLSVGETKPEMHAMIEEVNAILPPEKPRYLMGVGAPEDLVNGILRGIDIFDCVLPTRLARHGAALTSTGRMNLVNSCHAADHRPIEETCGCYTCQHFSRAYCGISSFPKKCWQPRWFPFTTTYLLLQLARSARHAIIENRYADFTQQYLLQITPS
jgi:queuine tRNA-ribosyltransferase